MLRAKSRFHRNTVEWRSFRGRTRVNAVPIVKVSKNALWTTLPTIFRPKGGDTVYSLKIFRGVIPPDSSGGMGRPLPALTSSTCLDPDTNFRLARQRSHCSCFTKRPQRYSVLFYFILFQIFYVLIRILSSFIVKRLGPCLVGALYKFISII